MAENNVKNEGPQNQQQQELTPEIALNTLYGAVRKLPASADDHDLLKNCALKIAEVIERDKQMSSVAKDLNEKSKNLSKIVKMPKEVGEPTEEDI